MALAATIDSATVKRFYPVRDVNNRLQLVPKPYKMYGGNSYRDGKRLSVAVYQGNSAIDRANGVSNQALRRFYDKVGNSNALVVAIIQRQQSLDMASSAIKSILDIALALKRRDKGYLDRIRRHYRRNNKFQVAKDFSGLWLQYWFGWLPLIGDIHSALGIFSDDLPEEEAVGQASGQTNWSTAPLLDYAGNYEGYRFATTVKCRVAARLSVADPNLNLFSRLGVDQPFGTVWEIIPFSFMVDYVFNIGECLSNLEPKYPGIKFLQPCTTYFYSGSYSYEYYTWPPKSQSPRIPYKRLPIFNSPDNGSIFGMTRSTQIPNFRFENRLPVLSGQKLSYVCAIFLQLFAHKAK